MQIINLIIKQDEDDFESAEVQVNGLIDNRIYNFILDTGSAMTCVGMDDYTSKFKSIGKKTSSGVFGETSDELINIADFKLGVIIKKDITIARIQNAEEMLVRNLVGMDILKEYSIYFSFEDSMIEINPQDIPVKDMHELELSKAYHPYVKVDIGGLITNSIWDSGAGITIVDMEFIKKNSSFFTEAEESQGTDSTGTKQATPMYIMKSITIGNRKFPPHKVAGVNLKIINKNSECHIDMILGYSTLSKANWFFDFPKKRWTICKIL
jgi:hypothetical protein